MKVTLEKRGLQIGHVFLFFILFASSATANQFETSSDPVSVVAVWTGASARADKNCEPNSAVFSKGEELVYEVSYLGIALGSITTRIVAVDTLDNSIRYRTECLIRSYKGVPFVTLNTRFRSITDSSLASSEFRTREYVSDTTYKYIEYSFPEGRDCVYISERVDHKPWRSRRDTVDLEGKKWQDGLSLFFYARAFSHNRCNQDIPVLMYRTKATTNISFGVDREDMEIDAVDYPIRTVKLEGVTGFTGIFGLTGEFEGWFSDDAAAVPIYAKMHVLIGSVRIELIRWKRNNWNPPVYEDD